MWKNVEKSGIIKDRYKKVFNFYRRKHTMSYISTKKIKDPNKKNELILFAQKNGCKAVFSTRYKGMVIECSTFDKERIIKEKVKELAD